MEHFSTKEKTFIKLLEKELYQRQKKNSSYSVRAYARDLDVPQSSLARILSSKRRPSDKFIRNVVGKLNLDRETLFFLLNKSKKEEDKKYDKLDIDKFSIVADWYHDAILELIGTHDFQGDVHWIAQRLDLPVNTVKDAVRRLQQVGWLQIDEEGRWLDLEGDNEIFSEGKDVSPLKAYQKQILENSLKVLETRAVHERNHTSLTFSASQSKYQEATKLITKFRRDLEKLMQTTDDPRDEVYQLHVGFFPITKKEEKGV